MEGFVGNGALKRVIPKLIEEGWDDVPTLKLMKSEDMDAINMTQREKEILELSTGEGTSNSSAPDPLQQPPQALTSSRSIHKASKMDPMLYEEAVGGKEEPKLVSQNSWFSRLFSWINWSSRPDNDNENNDNDVLHLMQYINGQQLELQLTSSKSTILHVAAQFGNKKYVEKILEKSPSLLRCLNIDGETPLHIAARGGHLDIVKALIERTKRLDQEEVESGGGAAKEMLRATNKDNDTALHMAVRRRSNLGVVEWLTKEDPEFTHPPNNAKETPLYLAAERDYDDMVFMILENCTSPAYGGPKGQTALHAAANQIWNTESTESTELLLKWKPDLIKKTDEYGWIPFHYAARYANKNGVKRILEKDKSVAYITTDEKGDEMTALHIAAANGNVNVMEELLLCCLDCWEMVNGKGQNVVHIAVKMEQKKVTEYILKKSWIIYLINKKDIEGNTPLHLLAIVFGSNIFRSNMPDGLWVELWDHSSGDQNVTNNNNLTPHEIMWGPTEDSSRVSSSISGRNIVGMDQDFISKLKEKWRENREKKETEVKEKRKLRLEENNRRAQTHLIVATLIATVTFAAGFTMPGGYDGNQGPEKGMPVLLRAATFQAFVITNTTAMICSISAGLLYASASFYNDVKKQECRHLRAFWLILVAMGAMVVAFITGTYTVLSHSLGIAITTCIVGSFSFFILIPESFKLYKYEYITDPGFASRWEEARIRNQCNH